MKKNIVASLFAIWYLMLFLWGAFIAIFNLVQTGRIYNPPPNFLMSIREPLVFIILPALYLISAIGVFKKSGWGRKLFIASSTLSLINLVFMFFVAFLPSGSYIFSGLARYFYIFCFALTVLGPHLGAILYFANPRIKIHFKDA